MINTVSTNNRTPARRPFLISAIVSAVTFMVIIYAGAPVYHSGDDLNIAWILGDGFGAGHSTCLPFLHSMPYWFSSVLVWLFKQFPGVNWFSWSMILTEYASATAICYVLMLRYAWQQAIPFFFLIMSCYGSFLLVYLHISSTAVMAITASLLLFWHAFDRSASRGMLTAAAIFLFAGTLFRFHVAFPLLVVAAPFFLLMKGWKKKLLAAAWTGTVMVISFLFVLIQENHYRAECPNWRSEETYRQAKYSNINYYRSPDHPAPAALNVELALLNDLILPDTATVPLAALKLIARESVSQRPVADMFTTDLAYWTFMNNRLAFLADLLSLYIFCNGRKHFWVMLASLAAAFAVVVYLVAFMKLPEFMVPALLICFTALAAASGAPEKEPWNKNRFIVTTAAMVLLIAWGTVRTCKTGIQNRNRFQVFRQAHAQLMQRPDLLYINMNDDEHFKYVSVFATPHSYPLKNFLFIDQPLSLRDAALLRDFGYTGFREAVNNPRVRFSGHPLKSVQAYFERATSKKLQWGEPDTTGNMLRIYKPMLVDSVIMDSK